MDIQTFFDLDENKDLLRFLTAGSVDDGKSTLVVRPGAEFLILPSEKKTRVKEIVTCDGNLDYAFPPQSVTLTVADELDISRGDMLVHPELTFSIEETSGGILVSFCRSEGVNELLLHQEDSKCKSS